MESFVDFWLGLAKNKRVYQAFLKEQYKDDSKPISPFAETQDEQFYDHDFLESEFTGEGLSLDEALHYVSFSSSFAANMNAPAEGIRFNFFIASFSDDFSNPKSAQVDGIDLHYLGRFEYDKNAGPVGNFDHLGSIYIHILNHSFLFETQITDCIKVNAMGLMIGKDNPYGRSLDISSTVPAVADCQLRISVNGEGIWELRDFGDNGLSRLGQESFDSEKSMPWPGIKFSVGDVEFLWSDVPK
jgi:hypothetical protein